MDTIGAAVFGSVLTLAGALVTNLFNHWRFERQLQFDKEQKSIERMTKLRTDVYLEAAMRSGQMGGYIVRVQSQLPSNELGTHDDYDAFIQSISKLSVVAEPETAFQANETLNAFSSTFATALAASLQLATLGKEVVIAAERSAKATEGWNGASAEMTAAVIAVTAEMTAANKAGGFPAALKAGAQLKVALANQRSARKRLKSASSKHIQLIAEHTKLQKECRSVVSKQLLATHEPTVALLAKIRKDLGLPTQNARLLEQIERQRLVAEADLAALEKAGADLLAKLQAKSAAADLVIDQQFAEWDKVAVRIDDQNAQIKVVRDAVAALELKVAEDKAEARALGAEVAERKGDTPQ